LYGITHIHLSSKRYQMMPYISYFILSALTCKREESN
jgi:hypothetical protein